MIKAMSRFVVAENFEEAEAQFNECFKKQEVLPDQVAQMFTDFAAEIESPKSSFWVMAKALKAFAESESRLPVQGTIPDMIAMPDFYLTL